MTSEVQLGFAKRICMLLLVGRWRRFPAAGCICHRARWQLPRSHRNALLPTFLTRSFCTRSLQSVLDVKRVRVPFPSRRSQFRRMVVSLVSSSSSSSSFPPFRENVRRGCGLMSPCGISPYQQGATQCRRRDLGWTQLCWWRGGPDLRGTLRSLAFHRRLSNVVVVEPELLSSRHPFGQIHAFRPW